METQINTLSDLLGLCKDISANKNILIKNNVYFRIEEKTLPDGGKTAERILLTAHKTRADLDNSIIRMCNGLLIHNEKVIARGIDITNINFKESEIESNWNIYNQFYVIDGTTVTVYYYNNMWCLASTNGYYINDYKYNPCKKNPNVTLSMGSEKTYYEMLADLFEKYNIGFDMLDKSLSYTFIFRHYDMHPFKKDPQRLCLVKIHAGSEDVTETTDVGALKKLMTQKMRSKPYTFKQLKDLCNNALSEHMRDNKCVHYGFILRAKCDIGRNTNILFESSLLRKIRQFMYDVPKNKQRPTDIKSWTLLRAYLNYYQRTTFKALFPQYMHTFTILDKIFYDAVSKIMESMRNRISRAELIEHHSDVSSLIAFVVVGDVERLEPVNTFDSTSDSILKDIVLDKKYHEIFYRILTTGDYK